MPSLAHLWPHIQGLNVLTVSFSRRRRDLEVVVCFIWQLDDGNFCGFASIGSAIKRLSPPRLSQESALAALIREGYTDANARAAISSYPSLGEFKYAYRHKAFAPVGWQDPDRGE